MGESKRRQKSGQPAARPPAKGRTPLVVGIIVVLLLVVVALYYVTRPPAPGSASLPTVPPTAEPFPAVLDKYGVAMGDPDAPVVVREFADYQCPACARFASATERLKEEYVQTGEVRFVFFDLPLRQHETAFPAAMAARCAGDQGAYWEMHDRLFANQSEWANSNSATGIFTRYAGELGLDERRFQRCLETDLHREAVEQSREVAMRLQVTSTPTVLVDNIPLSQPGWGQLSAVVERELAKVE